MGLVAKLLLAVLWKLAETTDTKRYCIIGAGPAGLQLGHFFKHAGRDYVIFEKNARPGSFFERYPRHRRLISLNKRNVREGRSEDFAFRHDWNTLIDVREPGRRTKPVTERAKELFPHASVLVEYLQEFAVEQSAHIRYNATVQKVQRAEGGGFTIAVDADGPAIWKCNEVILANGLGKARPAQNRVDGTAHLLSYEDLPSSGESFEGQAVIVLGQGNAALETAQELQRYTSEVHLLSRSRPLPEGGHGVRLAYQTHYVGDIRAGRTTIFDTYLLKSLDTFDFDALEALQRLAVVPCGGRLCVWIVAKGDCKNDYCRKNHDLGGQNLSYGVPIATVNPDSDLHIKLKEILNRYPSVAKRIRWRNGIVDFFLEEQDLNTTQVAAMGIDPQVFKATTTTLEVSTAALRLEPQLAIELSAVRQVGGHGNMRYPLDHVIRCFGWTFDSDFLDASLDVKTTHNRKYPKISPAWEVEGVPGMYAAGTLSHSLDFRKSAGGFIHGFRYTSRALFRLLEEKNFNVPWPQTAFALPSDASATGTCRMDLGTCGGPTGLDAALEPLLDMLLQRINSASGPYQMFDFLGDMVLFDGSVLRYLEEVPLAHFHARYKDTSRLTWVFRYNDNFHGPAVLSENRVGATRAEEAHRSNFLHPHIAFFPAGASKPTMRHWLLEDIFTRWGGADDRGPLGKFLSRVAASVMNMTRSM